MPILLSAAFLEMDVLVEDCLNYCHSYMNQILDTKQSFSCLSDPLIELMTRDVDLKVPCKAGRVILTNTGEIFYRHERYNQKCLVPMDQNLPTHVFCSHQGCDMELD